MFHDVLRWPTIVKTVSYVCVVRAIEGFLHTTKKVEKLLNM